MRIADYAEQVRAQILQSPHIVSHAFSYEDRASVAGLLKGTLTFSDGSRFHFKEFLRFSGAITRLKYAYQYLSAAGDLVFRYDNALDPAAKHLATYPDHKHTPTGLTISQAPTLSEVVREASRHIKRR